MYNEPLYLTGSLTLVFTRSSHPSTLSGSTSTTKKYYLGWFGFQYIQLFSRGSKGDNSHGLKIALPPEFGP